MRHSIANLLYEYSSRESLLFLLASAMRLLSPPRVFLVRKKKAWQGQAERAYDLLNKRWFFYKPCYHYGHIISPAVSSQIMRLLEQFIGYILRVDTI